MAVLAAAALLDELMGRNRNVAPNEKGTELNWEDPEYCKFFLVKFCPHDLFVNTRADLGACSKVHDEEVKKLFDQAKSHRKTFYQEEFVRFCTSMVNEVDRKIVKGKQRLALSGKGETSSLSPAQTQKNLEQINLLNERINGLVEEAEQAGNQGNVEQAQGLMKLCDQLKDERDNLKKINENSQWSATAELAAAQEKQMEVCEVCGAFLIVGDAQQRIDDHLMGKQHVGYARLKAAIQEVQALIEDVRQKEDRRPGGRMNFGGGSNVNSGMDDERRDRRGLHHHRHKRDRDRSDKLSRESRENDRISSGNDRRRDFNNTNPNGTHRNRDRRSHHHDTYRERDRSERGDRQSSRHSHRR